MFLPKAALAALLSIALVQPTVANAAPVTVNQGDEIRTPVDDNSDFVCTAGFIDPANHRIWTAGHCGSDGAEMFMADDRYIYPIGELVHRYNFVDISDSLEGEEKFEALSKYFFYDISYIDTSDFDVAGENIYSGDRVYTPAEDDTVCRYGRTTKKVVCAKIFSMNKHLIFAGSLLGESGDSGGPVWVPGKGYVGQFLGVAESYLGDEVLGMSIIHREDLAEIIEEPDAGQSFEIVYPSLDDLRNGVGVVKNADEVFGRNLPDPVEFARLLHEHEAAVSAAQQRVTELEANLATAGSEKQELESELLEAKQQLASAQETVGALKVIRNELEARNSALAAEIKEKEASYQEALQEMQASWEQKVAAKEADWSNKLEEQKAQHQVVLEQKLADNNATWEQRLAARLAKNEADYQAKLATNNATWEDKLAAQAEKAKADAAAVMASREEQWRNTLESRLKENNQQWQDKLDAKQAELEREREQQSQDQPQPQPQPDYEAKVKDRLEALAAENEALQMEKTIGIVAAVVAAILGLLAAAGGLLIPRNLLPF
ncbi:hypothetical protein [Corynebacterium phocae]|uniref:hypothetical protein n=1 Tax=Corynebacterium phocae TaxID=161895 RepID=UPI000951AC97|nr:hypothetical protein [Corynebacterium phocae]KAA8724172.1 hypothetical protein F4V58_06130 [Corynebacterium phocae]